MIIDLHGAGVLGVRVVDLGMDDVSRSPLGSSLSIRMLAMLSSPSAQARHGIPTRESRHVVVIVHSVNILRSSKSDLQVPPFSFS